MAKYFQNFLFCGKFCCLMLLAIVVGVDFAYAQLEVGNSDLTREIEKSLLFDKETQEQFDVYNDEYGSNKVAEPTIGSVPVQDDKKTYTPEELDIVLVDKVKIDKDIREKEKLAYNAVVVGQYEIGLELYKEILKKEPKNYYAKYSMGVIYQRLNQYKQAKNIYYDLLKDDVENKNDVINNIIAILIEESPREAIYMLNRLTKQNPDSAFLLANMAIASEKLGNNDDAISYYIKAQRLEPLNIAYSYNLGVLYDQQKDYEKAIEMYQLVIKNSVNSSNQEISIDLVKNRIEKIKQLI